MPSAHSILWFLAAFVALWAVSLIWRGVRGDRSAGRRCPSCSRPVGAGAKACADCGFEATRDRDWLAARRNWRMVLGGLALLPCAAGAAVGGRIVWGWFQPGDEFALSMSVWNSAAVATAAFALVLMVWAIRGDRSRGRRRCPACWYDMTGGSLRCPECGREATHVKDLYRPRRYWKRAAFASLLLLAAACMPGVPRYQRGGWRALIPTTVLIAGFEWLPDEAIVLSDASLDQNWTLMGPGSARPEIWGWQRDWLQSKVRTNLSTSDDPRALLRAIIAADGPLTAAHIARIAGASARTLGSGSADDIDTAERLVIHVLLQSEYALHGDVIRAVRPHSDALVRILHDPGQQPSTAASAATLLAIVGDKFAASFDRAIQLASGAGAARALWMAVFRTAAETSPQVRGELRALIDGPDTGLSTLAMVSLTYRNMCDDETGSRLMELAQSSPDGVRAAAAASRLLRCNWRPEEVIGVLLDRIESGDAGRVELCRALWGTAEHLQPSLPRLVALMHDPDPQMRHAAIQAVHYLASDLPGLSGTIAVPAAIELSNDSDPTVAAAAAELLASIRAFEAHEVLNSPR